MGGSRGGRGIRAIRGIRGITAIAGRSEESPILERYQEMQDCWGMVMGAGYFGVIVLGFLFFQVLSGIVWQPFLPRSLSEIRLCLLPGGMVQGLRLRCFYLR